MSVPSDCLTTWVEAGCGRIDWLAALEWTRLDLDADAIALARRVAGPHWRLDCAGPGAGALTDAFHAAMVKEKLSGDDLVIAPVAARDPTYLVAWRARRCAALDAYVQPVAAALLARRFAAPAERIMLESLPFAAALVDRSLTVNSCNGRALALFNMSQGLWLEQGRLTLAQDGDAQSLCDCVARALMTPQPNRPALTRIAQGPGRYPVAALAASERDLCLLVIVDRQDEMRALWRGMMELDPSELHLASAILAGRDHARPI